MAFEKFIKFIEDTKKKIKNVINDDPRKYVSVMEDFWEQLSGYYRNDEDEKLAYQFQSCENYIHYQNYFRRAQAIYERAIELEDLQILLKKTIPKLNKDEYLSSIKNQFNQFTNTVISEEIKKIEAAQFGGKFDFVMVGCGPLAQTLLLFHFNYPSINCIGIDRDATAIVAASYLLHKFKKDLNNVTYETLDGEKFDYKNAKIIFVANIVSSKVKVLNQIALTAKPNTIVIVRDPRGLSKLFYDEAEYRETKKLSLINRHNNNISAFMHDTIVLRVND